MKGLKDTLIPILAIGLLAGSTVGATAQDDEAPAEPITAGVVTGTIEVGGGEYLDIQTRIWDEEREVEELRGRYLDDPITMDDPRLSGRLRSTVNLDTHGGRELAGQGTVAAGRTELFNDEGTWTGTFRGYRDVGIGPVGFPERVIHWHVELAGTGAYEGQSALLYIHGDPSGEQILEVEGFVFPGVSPEYPDSILYPESVLPQVE